MCALFLHFSKALKGTDEFLFLVDGVTAIEEY